MNRFAGIIGPAGNQREREERLRKAIAGPDTIISHPHPEVSIGWCGISDLIGEIHTKDCFAITYGSAHGIAGAKKPEVSVDHIDKLAIIICQRIASDKRLLDNIAGSFIALAGKNNAFTLAGDPSGNRNPYFTITENELGFSNHPLVCARLQYNPSVDRGFEDFLLVYGFHPDNLTTYKDVRLLPKGCCLENMKGQWTVETVSYVSDSEDNEDIPESEESLYDKLYEKLLKSTEDQLASVSEVGVLLGGFDSALVAALLHRLGKRVRTYSFRYSESQFNQPHTDTLSEHIGSKHTWVDITPEIIAKGLDEYAEYCIRPTNWLAYVIQTVFVCEQMHQDGLEYAYSGDGCDGAFLGYPGTYKRTHTFSILPQLPAGLVEALISAFGWPGLDRTIGHPYRVAMGLLRAMARPMPARAFLTFRVMDEITVNALRRGKNPPQHESIESVVHRLAQPYKNTSIQRLGYLAKAFSSPNIVKLCASTDVTGVRVHTPYLHPVLRNFVAKIPAHLLREETQSSVKDIGKICLSRMAEKHRLLPNKIIYQPKLAAIDSPIDSWFASELRPSLYRAFAGLPFAPDSRHLNALIKTTWAERFYKRHIGSTRVISDAISLIATYGAMCGALKNPGK